MRIYTPPDARLIPDQAIRVFSGTIYDVYQWDQELFDGTSKVFEMLKRPDTVEVIGVVEGSIIINYEEQPDMKFITTPGGRHDEPEETELEAAKREMQEETGYQFASWKLVGARQAATKIEHMIYTFVATDVTAVGDKNLDAGERIETKLVSFPDVKNLITDPEFKYCPQVLAEAGTLEELLNLPTLHTY